MNVGFLEMKNSLVAYKPPSCSNGNTTANASPTKNTRVGFAFVPNDGERGI